MILPSLILYNCMLPQLAALPVGGWPPGNGPVLVPCVLNTATTWSPSATKASTLRCMAGKTLCSYFRILCK